MRERWGRPRYLVTAGALLVILFVLNLIPTGYFTVQPGPLRSLEGVVAVDGRPEPAGSFYMVSVVAREASAFDAARAAFDPSIALWPKAAVYGGASPEQYVEDSKGMMEDSQRIASYLAFRESGFQLEPASALPLPVLVNSGEVIGPSAGLAFALEMISTLAGADLTGGKRVAATGVLDLDGNVGAVGGIAQKAVSCRLNGIDLFLVPATDAAEARRHAGAVQVVGVRNLGEAVRYLRGDDSP